jgi:hypothetical protein
LRKYKAASLLKEKLYSNFKEKGRISQNYWELLLHGTCSPTISEICLTFGTVQVFSLELLHLLQKIQNDPLEYIHSKLVS